MLINITLDQGAEPVTSWLELVIKKPEIWIEKTQRMEEGGR